METFYDPGFIELIFVFSVAFCFGFWELFDLRRARNKREAGTRVQGAEAARKSSD